MIQVDKDKMQITIIPYHPNLKFKDELHFRHVTQGENLQYDPIVIIGSTRTKNC